MTEQPDNRRRCTATSKRSGKQCQGLAMKGQDVCRMHGGSAPQAREAGERREIARRAVMKLALVNGDDIERVDPRDVLAEELWRSHCAVHVLGTLVNELDLDRYGIYAPMVHQSGVHTGEAKPHVLWVMWMDERKHLKTVAAAAAAAGVEERRQQLAESQAQTVAMLLRAVFSDPELSMTAEAQRGALAVAARHLRQLPGG